ncbi:MAG TPA: hypothetical protein VLX68_13575 [Chitinivibrionales bacterium]|nr:hypothetical protein [Chitinivibrionales bacterium]
MRKMIALCAGFLLVFGAGLVLAQDETIVAEGFGEGANPEEALLAAKRNAIEKGIGTILLSQTEIENFMVKKDQIITKTIGSVKSYEKISEGKSEAGSYEVKIKAVLSKSSITQDLAAFHILIESMNKPRTMVVIDENNVGTGEPTNSSAEATILQFLKDPYEFDLVDPKASAAIRASQEKMASIAGDVAAAAQLGTQSGAEVIITGSAVSREAKNLNQNLGGMVSVQADVTLRAINCTTGSIMGTAQEHAAMVHVSANTAGTQAIAKASQKAIRDLLDKIVKEWNNQQNNGMTLSITISGVSTFRLKNDLIQTLTWVPNVSAVHERNWDMQSKLLMVDLQYKGNANGFCTRIDGFKLKSGAGSIAVSGLNGLRVSLQVQAM